MSTKASKPAPRPAAHVWLALLVAVALLGSSACGGSSDQSASARPVARPDLERVLRRFTQLQHSAAVALLRTQDGTWRGAAGYAQWKRRAAPANRFGIASTTKTFVATVVLQLVGEERISLDDSVEHWLPGLLRAGRRISVRQLLNHTSGLVSAGSFGPPPRESVEAMARYPLASRPGTTHHYSNTNYDVLGLIVEKVTGQSLDQVVRDRIIRPLHLDDTSYGTVRPTATARRPPSAWLGVPQELGGLVSGAGGIVSTADDLASFFQALLRGELLSPGLLAEMTQTVETGSDLAAGLGLFRLDLACTSAWGHGGDQGTYSNQVLIARDGSRIVVLAQNTTGWPNAKAAAEEMYCS